MDAIAVTAGPGLAGALLVGVAAAKALALALGKPLYGVNHLAAHVAVDQLEHGPLPEPCLAMLVSGGHSSLLLRLGRDVVRRTSRGHHRRRGRRGLRQGRPAARPAVPRRTAHRRAAASGTGVAITFPRGLSSGRDLERHRFDFSFSGLKTAVARWVEARERVGEPVPVADVAASFQEAVCDVLTRKAVDACRRARASRTSLLGGGVAANSRLRALAEERCGSAGASALRVPRPGLCTDNGAMVAALGAEMVARGRAPSAARAARGLLDAGDDRPGLRAWASSPVVEEGALAPVAKPPGGGWFKGAATEKGTAALAVRSQFRLALSGG